MALLLALPGAAAGAPPATLSDGAPERVAVPVGGRNADLSGVPAPRRAPEWMPAQRRFGAEAVPVDRRAPERIEFVPRRLACDDAVRLAREVAGRHGLEAGLVLGVMRVESGFTSNVLSPVSAVGLMQVMPASGRQSGCGDLFDAAANADCGARILKAFLRYYKGSLILALSGYNAGHAMPDKARKATRVPRNFPYVEDVLRARARYLRFGCEAFGSP